MQECKLIKSSHRKIERAEQKPEAKLIWQFKFSLQDQEKIKKAQERIKQIINPTAVEQLFFVLSIMQNKSWVNQCDKAVKTLGINLTEHFDDKKSFFDLMPQKNINFMEARTEKSLKNNFRRDNHHNIAMLEFQREKEKFYLVVDLVYGEINFKEKRENVLVLCYQGEREAVLNKLNEYYGGKWKIVNFLNKKKKNFRYNIE